MVCSGDIASITNAQIITRFFDDIDLLRQRWHSENVDTVAEL